VGVADIIGLAAAAAVAAVATVACLPAVAVETLAAPTVRGGGITTMSTEVAPTVMVPVVPGVLVRMELLLLRDPLYLGQQGCPGYDFG
jgi:hypothetical protein